MTLVSVHNQSFVKCIQLLNTSSVQNNIESLIQTLFNPHHTQKSIISSNKIHFDAFDTNQHRSSYYYLSLCKTFYCLYNDEYLQSKHDLELISICCKIPIAQFIVDIYTQMVVSHNLTINDFMDKSKFLSNLPRDSNIWRLIRKHLSEYLEFIYKPINNKIAPLHVKQIKLYKILRYISDIHNVLKYSSRSTFGIRDPYQLDTLFIPKSMHWINTGYFDKIGIKKYMKWNTQNKKVTFGSGFNEKYQKLEDIYTISKLWRNFNKLCDKQQFKRFIMLIKCGKNDRKDPDEIFIFEPLKNNKLPSEISEYTELPWICNSKSEVFTNIIPQKYGVLGISFHIHCDAERVYFSNGSCYGTRVFKRNLIEIISPYCINDKNDGDNLQWNQESEFADEQYNKFVNKYFSDL